jgi:hypothetical protein
MPTDAEHDDLCKWCGGLIALGNPMGNCSHVYWPDFLTDEAKRANGFTPKLTIAWMKEDATKEEMIDFIAGSKF